MELRTLKQKMWRNFLLCLRFLGGDVPLLSFPYLPRKYKADFICCRFLNEDEVRGEISDTDNCDRLWCVVHIELRNVRAKMHSKSKPAALSIERRNHYEKSFTSEKPWYARSSRHRQGGRLGTKYATVLVSV